MHGIVINIDPVALDLGGLQVRWYSMFVILALIAGTAVGVRTCKKIGIDSGKVYSLVMWIALGGVIGARLFHILDHLGFYLANPGMIIGFQGLAIWGALIGGGAAILIWARAERVALLPLLDAAVPAALVGQVIGRFACIVNGDAYGGATSLPWGFIYLNPGAAIPEYLKGVPTHPYPVYEQLWNLAALGGLLLLRRKFQKPGMLFLAYVSVYATGRFLLTFVRQETVLFWGLQEAQVVSIALFAIALPLLVWMGRRAPKEPAAVAAS